jgi:hypothetical protein
LLAIMGCGGQSGCVLVNSSSIPFPFFQIIFPARPDACANRKYGGDIDDCAPPSAQRQCRRKPGRRWHSGSGSV